MQEIKFLDLPKQQKTIEKKLKLNLEKYLNFNLCTAYMDAKPINIFLTCDLVEDNPSTLYTTKIEIINKRKTTVQIVLSPSNFIFLERFNIWLL